MRSGGSVLKAAGPFTYWGAAEGGTPPRASSASGLTNPTCANILRNLIGTEKALRYLGEPFLYVLELAKLNLDGIAAMRSGGSVLKALSAAEGALPREHRLRAGRAELCREREPVRRL